MLRYGMICLMCCLLGGSTALADVKVVVTKDPSRVLTGEVTDTSEGIEVQTSLGVIRVPRHQIVSITDYVDPEQDYSQRLEKLADDDVQGHIDLGRWAIENGLLEAGKERFEHAIALDGENREATLLLRRVEAMIKQRDEKQVPDEPGGKVGGNDGDAVASGTFDPKWLVSMDDVFRIRMAEIKEGERVRVEFDNDVLDRFAKAMTGREDAQGNMFDEREFKRLGPADKLIYILDNIDRDDTDIRNDIRIVQDPEFMKVFKETIWKLRVEPSCGAAQCHGGTSSPGGLKLLPYAGTSDEVGTRTLYTNFLILDMYRATEGPFKGQQLINRNRPENSLLLQFGLPSNMATFVHPNVDGWAVRPLFTGLEDPRYVSTFEWITQSLYGPVHPYYNVNFTPPLPNPAGEDTGKQETQPPAEPESPAPSPELPPQPPPETPAEPPAEIPPEPPVQPSPDQ